MGVRYMSNTQENKDYLAYCDERGFFTLKQCYDEEVEKDRLSNISKEYILENEMYSKSV